VTRRQSKVPLYALLLPWGGLPEPEPVLTLAPVLGAAVLTLLTVVELLRLFPLD
jgi:hypothetical protein